MTQALELLGLSPKDAIEAAHKALPDTKLSTLQTAVYEWVRGNRLSNYYHLVKVLEAMGCEVRIVRSPSLNREVDPLASSRGMKPTTAETPCLICGDISGRCSMTADMEYVSCKKHSSDRA